MSDNYIEELCMAIDSKLGVDRLKKQIDWLDRKAKAAGEDGDMGEANKYHDLAMRKRRVVRNIEFGEMP